MILKAGTYRFNDEITIPSIEFMGMDLKMVMIVGNIKSYTKHYADGIVRENFDGLEIMYEGDTYWINMYYRDFPDDEPFSTGFAVYISNENPKLTNGFTGEITLLEDITLTDTIMDEYTIDGYAKYCYDAFVSNTNYNEVNATPLAEILYNGETIAQLNAGDKATIPCSQYNMSKDLVFKVNEGASGETYIPYAEGVKF